MPRGSMPGERRGGRTRATPNRRTILADRMMAVLDGCSKASPKERLSKLIDDAELPADIRMAVAQMAYADRAGGVRRARRAKSEIHTVVGTQQSGPRAVEAPSGGSLPAETMGQAVRDAVLGIVSDASASARARRKAATKLASYFLPNRPVNKRWRFTADECGFAINGEIAREYRAIDFELRDLKRHPNRDFPEFAQRIRKLQARIDAVLQRLQCPCPSRYGDTEISEDIIRLAKLADKRTAGIALSAEEDAEEAHRKARFDCYMEGSERTLRRRRRHLEDTDNLFRKNCFFRDPTPPPLSRRERNKLWLLRRLYPPPHRKSDLSTEAQAEADANMAIAHPFRDEKPAADGNFYPHDSKLRPASEDEPVIIEEYTPIPPHCILTPGQPPIYTFEPPINSLGDKSGPSNANATPSNS